MSDEEDAHLDDLLRFEASLRDGSPEPQDSNPSDSNDLKRCLELLDAYRQMRSQLGSELDRTDDESVPPQIPHQIGPYHVRVRLGVGTSGVVYLAEDPDTGDSVAVKLLRPEGLLFSEIRQRFEREAKILHQLCHPHIAEIRDTGEHQGLPYIVSTYCEGSSLQQLIPRHGPFDSKLAARLAKQMADAIQFAHANGVIHRDIKPSNVLIEHELSSDALQDCHVRLIDFGLATISNHNADATDSSLTQTGHALGTVAYMPPEQAAGRRREIGPQSDVWSIGVVLFEMLTGTPMFGNVTALELVNAVESSSWNPFRTVDPDALKQIPEDLQTIILTALASLPADRYQSASDLAEDLSLFCQSQPIKARRLSLLERVMRWTAHHRRLAGSLLAISVAAIIALFTVMSVYSSVLSNRARELTEALHQKELAIESAFAAESVAKQREREAITLRQRAEVSEREARKLSYRYSIKNALELFQQGQLARSRELLQQQIPNPSQQDVRGFEWQLLNAELQARIHYFGHHNGAATEAAIFADGRMAASVGEDGLVKVWDLASEKLVRQFDPQLGPIHSIAVTPDEAKLAVGDMAIPDDDDMSHVYLLDIRTGEVLQTLHAHHTTIEAIDFSPDGQRIASASRYQSVVVSDLQGGDEFIIPTGDRCPNKTVRFSPNSKYLAVLWFQGEQWERELQIWDVDKQTKAFSIKPSTHNAITDFCWRNDDTVVVSDAWHMEIWLIEENRQLVLYSLPKGAADDRRVELLTIDGDKDTQLVATDLQGDVFLWSKRYGEWGREPNVGLGVHLGRITDLNLVGSSHLLTTGYNGSLALLSPWGRPWSIQKVRFTTTAATYDASTRSFYLGTGRGEIYRYNSQGACNRIYGPEGYGIQDLQAVDGKLAAVDNLGTVTFIDPHTGQHLKRFDRGKKDGNYHLSASGDGKRLAAVGIDSRLRLFDVERQARIGCIDTGRQGFAIACSPDGKQVAVGETEVTVFDFETGTIVDWFPAGTTATALRYDPTGHILASSHTDGSIRITNLESGRTTVGRFPNSQCRSMRFESDSERLVTMDGKGGQFRVWDVTTGECLGSTQKLGHDYTNYHFVFGMDRMIMFDTQFGETQFLDWPLEEPIEPLWKRREKHDVALDTKPLPSGLAAGLTVALQNVMVPVIDYGLQNLPPSAESMSTSFFNGIVWKLGHNAAGLQTFQRANVETVPDSPTYLAGDYASARVFLADSPEPPRSAGWYVHYVPNEQYTIVMECIGPSPAETHFLLGVTPDGQTQLVEQQTINLERMPENLKWKYFVLAKDSKLSPDAVGLNIDRRFGDDGQVRTDFHAESDIALGVATQDDGKWIVVGEARQRGQWDFAIARYDANGAPDLTFGTDGKVTTDFSSTDEIAQDVVVQSDGKIVVVGSCGSSGAEDFIVARYHPDGSLDKDFGTNGCTLTDIMAGSGARDMARSVALQDDGKIVVVGSTASNETTNRAFVVARYNADGSLDTSFNGSGTNTIDFGTDVDDAYDVVIDEAGRIIIAGLADGVDFGLACLNASGQIDTSFGQAGRVVTDVGGGIDSGQGIVLQADGRIVVGGFSHNGNDFDFALVRYSADGVVDLSFGDVRIMTKIGTANDRAHDVLLQPDGKIILVGSTQNETSHDIAAVRYYGNGMIDRSFGNDGIQICDLGGDDFGYRAALHGLHHLVVTGSSTVDDRTDFATVRLSIDSIPVTAD